MATHVAEAKELKTALPENQCNDYLQAAETNEEVDWLGRETESQIDTTPQKALIKPTPKAAPLGTFDFSDFEMKPAFRCMETAEVKPAQAVSFKKKSNVNIGPKETFHPPFPASKYTRYDIDHAYSYHCFGFETQYNFETFEAAIFPRPIIETESRTFGSEYDLKNALEMVKKLKRETIREMVLNDKSCDFIAQTAPKTEIAARIRTLFVSIPKFATATVDSEMIPVFSSQIRPLMSQMVDQIEMSACGTEAFRIWQKAIDSFKIRIQLPKSKEKLPSEGYEFGYLGKFRELILSSYGDVPSYVNQRLPVQTGHGEWNAARIK